MNWDFKQWSALAAAADCGSFEQAAVQLNITASAVSKRIRDLEEAAGAVLLTRARPCRPTAEGRRLLRYWRQMVSLQQALENELSERPARLSLAVNHDSLDTWLLPVLTQTVARENMLLDIQTDDQDYTLQLLAEGRVMAAVSSRAEPIKGCEAHLLGALRYRLRAAPDFAAKWFSDGLNMKSMKQAPLLTFNRKDDLQNAFLQQHVGIGAAICPVHYIPSSYAFVRAVVLGLGYGMLMDAQVEEEIRRQRLVDLCPGAFLDVPLYWHCWQVQPPNLARLPQLLKTAAAAYLADAGA
ncbi:MAG: LysR family transcriptional regulator ArgP [Neisseria sp.]|nr:LysR family transcriptional regulator ArgP [Neisseria sp.]